MVGLVALGFFFFFSPASGLVASCLYRVGRASLFFRLSPSLQAVCYAMLGPLDNIVFLSLRHVISFRKRDVLIILCCESWFFRLPSWR